MEPGTAGPVGGAAGDVPEASAGPGGQGTAGGAGEHVSAPGRLEAPAERLATSLRTRASALWAALAAGMVLLVVVLVFILENLQQVRVSFFTVHWDIPLGIDLLLAAVLGGLVVFSAGAVRLFQLRRQARRQTKRAVQG